MFFKRVVLKQYTIYVLVILILLSGMYNGILNFFGLSLLFYLFVALYFGLTLRDVLKYKYSGKKIIILGLSLLLLFCTFVSVIYSNSNYSVNKLLIFFVSIYMLFSAIYDDFYYKDYDKFMKLLFSFIFGLNIVYFLFILYFNGNLYLFENFNDKMLPNYLTIAIYSYSVCFYGFRSTMFNKLISLFIIGVQIYMGGRGPFLFFVLIITINYVRYEKLSNVIKYFIGFLLIVSSLWNYGVFDNMLSRLELLSDLKGNTSTSTRLIQYNESIEKIFESPVIGYGLNSTGIEITPYIDGNLKYPHNVLIEIWLEVGIVAFLIFLLFYINIIIEFIFAKKNNIETKSLTVLSIILFIFLNALKSHSFAELRILYFFIGMYFFVLKPNSLKN